MKQSASHLVLGLLLAAPAAAGESSWVDSIEFGGDLRYRHEAVMEDGKTDRNRQRVRLRLGMEVEASENVNVGLRLATGGLDDPVSTNQTLADDAGAANRGFNLDLAYFDWKMGDVHLVGGKMKNPFHNVGKGGLIWDGDLTPEGLALKYASSFGPIEVGASGGGFWILERKAAADSLVYGGQASVKYKPEGGAFDVNAGMGFYGYTEVKGQMVFVDESNPFGNSATDPDPLDTVEEYEYDYGYNQLEAFVEGGFKVAGLPVSVFADFVTNLHPDVDQDNVGYLAGFKIGKAKNPNTWEFKYSYRRLEKDAVLGAFCDSDFAGGGTDGQGHVVGVGYAVKKNANLGLTCIFCEKGIDSDTDYTRFQFDMGFKF